ncbi:MAG: hypothetical protein ONB46_20020 [candidate division KSB1 bacterium]|nr:hypothetical protein [candidate division KSB1 bacterium]MDZ7369253.1 hypothetical protein [candidate division KSB1 bacterium]
MKPKFIFLLAVFTSLAFVPPPLLAQPKGLKTTPLNKESKINFWFSINRGISGEEKGPAKMASINLQYKKLFLSAQYAKNFTGKEKTVVTIPYPTQSYQENTFREDTFKEYNLLFGLGENDGAIHFTLSTGISLFEKKRFVFNVKRDPNRRADIWSDDLTFSKEYLHSGYKLGVPIRGEIFVSPFRFLGLGISGFGNLNSEKSYGGFSLGLHFGKLR